MQFTDEVNWDIVTGSVIFFSGDGNRIAHQVSEEALQDHFGFEGPAEKSPQAFRDHQVEIQRLAEIAVKEGQVNQFGGANITSAWLTTRRYRRI